MKLWVLATLVGVVIVVVVLAFYGLAGHPPAGYGTGRLSIV